MTPSHGNCEQVLETEVKLSFPSISSNGVKAPPLKVSLGNFSVQNLQNCYVIRRTSESEMFPSVWKKGMIVRIPKNA